MPKQAAPRMRDWFTSTEAAKLAGLTTHMVHYLGREGIVKPSHHDNERGKGLRNKFTFADLVSLRTVANLLAQGVLVSKLKRALRGLQARHPDITLDKIPARFLLIDGNRQLYFEDDKQSFERLSDGQLVFAFVMEFEQIRNQVKSRLTAKQLEIANRYYESRSAA